MSDDTTPGRADLACPVCLSIAEDFMTVAARRYYRCPTCQARFLDPAHFLSVAQERAHYLTHQNLVDDPGYRGFLSKLVEPLLQRLPPGAQGLDYGCGPGPALVAMLQETGHSVTVYDPCFAPDPTPLAQTYHFVTCTEVAEHFHHPVAEFARLRGLVRPGGWLAVMTCFQTDDARFAGWQYRADPTHVVFYRDSTFRYLAQLWGWRCEIPIKDVALLQRPLV